MKKILCLIMGAALLFSLSSCSARDEIIGEIGYTLTSGDYIYYINGGGYPSMIADNYDVASGALCRMKKDGSFRQIIVPMCIGAYQIAGERIYTVSVLKDSEGYEVGVCNLDGSGYKRVTTIESGSIQYAGGYLFVLDGNIMYRMSPEGHDKRAICRLDITSAAFDAEHIYYTYVGALEAGLYRMDFNGENAVRLVNDECFIVKMEGDSLYYQHEGGSKLSRYDKSTGKSTGMVYTPYEEFAIDFENMLAYGARAEETPGIVVTDMQTGEKRELCTDYAEQLSFYNGRIYYLNNDDNGFIYELDPETGEKRLMSAAVPLDNGYGIADGYIYYISPNENSKPFRVNIETLERQEIGIRKT